MVIFSRLFYSRLLTKQQFDPYNDILIVLYRCAIFNEVCHKQKEDITLPNKVGYNNATEKDQI